jgi:RNA polymerase sigma-70 factor (ECF subfamily)
MLAFLQPRPKLDEFQNLLQTRGARWYNACLRVTRDEGLAEDAVQEALLKAWREREQFRGEAELDTWIHRIALNAAIDLMRRRKSISDEEIDADQEAAPPSVSPETAYTQTAMGRDLGQAMARLTAMERQSFVLKHLEGWKLDEIAARQGTSVNNTKQALFRAVKKLRVDMDAWRGES